MTVSIIIPVFNAEKYIYKCLDSVLAQTYADFEVILVNDCSPDNSGVICDEYAAKDKRIKVIHHKTNSGVSVARQTGTDAAQGDYTIHVDPDDWVESDMLEKLVIHAQKTDADMVICDYWIYSKDLGDVYQHQNLEQNLSAEDVLKKIVFGQLHGSCCNKLVRRACYSNIRFSPSNLTCFEDMLFNIRILGQNIKVSYLPKAFYHYRHNQQSITHFYSSRTLKSQIVVIEEFEKFLFAKSYDDFYVNKKYALFLALILKKYNQLPILYPEVHERIKNEGKKYRWYMPQTCCLSLALKGYPQMARYLYVVNMKVIKLKDVIKGWGKNC